MHLPSSGSGAVYENVGWSAATSRGATITASASSNTYGAWVELIASTVYTWEYIHVQIEGNSVATRYRVDIGIGAAGSEFAVVSGLQHCVELTAEAFATKYTIPVHVPKGSRVAARIKSNTSSAATARVSVTGYSRGPTKAPGYANCEALNGSTMLGATVDCGATANTKSAWVQIIASTSKAYRGLMATVGGNNDISRAATGYQLFDVGVGAAASESVIVSNFPLLAPLGIPETHVMQGFPPLPIMIPAGSRLAVRAQGSVTTTGDRVIDVSLYGLT